METTEKKDATQNVPLTDTDWLEWSGYVLRTFGVPIDEQKTGLFKIFLRELKSWNSNINLVSFKNDKEVLYRHFADSLAGVKLIDKLKTSPDPKIADIGTGAGFPGIPVYIASAYKNLTLMESITKKTLFISHIKETISMPDLKIMNGRVEDIARDNAHRGSYDFVLSRAVSKLSPNIEIALPLLKIGGYALIYKTERSASDEELSNASKALKSLGGENSEKFCYTIPYEEQSYCLVALKKTSDTPGSYPRRAGIPEKKPL